MWKLTIRTPERRQIRRYGVLIVNFKHIFLHFADVYSVDFEQVNSGLVRKKISIFKDPYSR